MALQEAVAQVAAVEAAGVLGEVEAAGWFVPPLCTAASVRLFLIF